MATFEMNGYYSLEVTIKNILHVINPSKDDWDIRFHIIQEIRAIVESMESLRGATVEPYGSFVSNLFSKEGDLDISIDLQNGQFILCPGRKHKQSLLGELHSVLRNKGGFRRVTLIPNARVPILKIQSNFNISCDISLNNLVGKMKSIMLYWINDIDGRFRDLVLLVKEWAKSHKINDSRNGSLNSYSLTLLVIFHLQTLVPAILPPLQQIFPSNMSETLVGVKTVAVKNIEDVCAVNIKRIKLDKSRRVNRSTLAELFISFLAKISHICSQSSTEGISPFSGQSEEITSNMTWLPKTYALFIEDPFEQPANTARTVSSNQLLKISEAIRTTQAAVYAANASQASLLSVLVVPQIACLLMPKPMPTQHPWRAPAGKTKQLRKPPALKRQDNSQGIDERRNVDTPQARRNGVAVLPPQAPSVQRAQVWKPRS